MGAGGLAIGLVPGAGLGSHDRRAAASRSSTAVSVTAITEADSTTSVTTAARSPGPRCLRIQVTQQPHTPRVSPGTGDVPRPSVSGSREEPPPVSQAERTGASESALTEPAPWAGAGRRAPPPPHDVTASAASTTMRRDRERVDTGHAYCRPRQTVGPLAETGTDRRQSLAGGQIQAIILARSNV